MLLATVETFRIRIGGAAAVAGLICMHKVTSDLTDIAAQVPALVEALSGVPMTDLLSKVRKLGDKAGHPPAGV